MLMPDGESKPVRIYLFACIHNAGRSQMAAALFDRYGNSTECCAVSAGTQPAAHIHPEVVDIMREIGIDLSKSKPQKLTLELARTASVLVTMGCGEECPYVPGLKTVDWVLPDLKGKSSDEVRAIRDQIEEKVKSLLRNDCAECAPFLQLSLAGDTVDRLCGTEES